MYSYHPHRSPQHSPRSLAKLSFRPTFFASAAAVLLFGWLVSQSIASQVFARSTQNLPTDESLILPRYEARLARETDATRLAARANALLEKHMPRYAQVTFKRASELDPNFRDAAYGWAYSIVKKDNGHLSDSDKQEMTTALNRAETVDPFYVPVLKLKQFLADIEQKPEITQQIQARLQALEQIP